MATRSEQLKTMPADMAFPVMSTSLPGHRQTQPTNWQPFQAGGVGIIPRRGVTNPLIGFTGAGLQALATKSPQRLMKYLRTIHPTVGFADWTAKRLAFAPGAVQIVATQVAPEVKSPGEAIESTDDDPTPAPKSGAGDEIMDAYGTAKIRELFEGLPPEIGGLDGLCTQLMNEALYSGNIALEAVPGERMQGVRRIWPIPGESLDFGRDSAEGDIVVYQRQRGIIPAALKALPGGYVRLDPERTFWRSVDPDVDDPYGVGVYAGALSEALADLALYQDIRDAVHAFGHPRGIMEYDLTELWRFAVEVLNLPTDATAAVEGELTAAQWVKERVLDIKDQVEQIKTDDWIVKAKGGSASYLTGGSFQGIQGILEFLRTRIMQSLRTLPTLMGVNDGSTQTYTSVEFAVYAAGLETLRALVVAIVVEAAKLHLRLLGLPLSAKAKYEKIRTTDGLNEANRDSVEDKNAAFQRDQGWIGQDEASIKRTGSKAVGDPIRPPANGQDSTDTTTPTDSGTSQEEQQAGKRKKKRQEETNAMKEDAKRLLLAVAKLEAQRQSFAFGSGLSVRNLVDKQAEAGEINRKRAHYLLEKWSDKGWYDYGTTVDLGWLTDEGKAMASMLHEASRQ